LNLIEKLDKVTIIRNNKNLGVARALNIAAKIAIEQGFEWLMTMDQDSYFDENDIAEYITKFEKYKNTERMGIFTPSLNQNSNALEINQSIHSITSGSIINLKMYTAIGGFDDYLFIDEVDSDFSYKASLNNYLIFNFGKVFMHHNLGRKLKTGFFKYLFVKERTIHNPFRIYFMVRNYFIIRSRYKKSLPEIFKSRDKDFFIMLKNNLLFSGQPFKMIIRSINGFHNYLKKNA
jgi:rhamnosyltransferase